MGLCLHCREALCSLPPSALALLPLDRKKVGWHQSRWWQVTAHGGGGGGGLCESVSAPAGHSGGAGVRRPSWGALDLSLGGGD